MISCYYIIFFHRMVFKMKYTVYETLHLFVVILERDNQRLYVVLFRSGVEKDGWEICSLPTHIILLYNVFDLIEMKTTLE